MTAPQVLLIGKRNEESVALKQQLSRNTGFQVDLASVANKAIQQLTSGNVDLCVFNFDLFTQDRIQMAMDIRSLGFDLPVLVLSRIIAMDAYEGIQNMKNTILLEKPFEQKDLTGICEKMIARMPVNQRFHRRFYTNQWTSMSPFKGGDASEAKLFNLSRGGAYLEVPNAAVKTGDVVQLKIQLQEVYRKYNVNAKVIWTNKVGVWGTGAGVGLEFLKAKDVYRDLLHKI